MTYLNDLTLPTELLDQVAEQRLDFIPLMDRVAGRLSSFMLCAVCVQIEYHNMEIIDAVWTKLSPYMRLHRHSASIYKQWTSHPRT
jgi:hypothetical protein